MSKPESSRQPSKNFRRGSRNPLNLPFLYEYTPGVPPPGWSSSNLMSSPQNEAGASNPDEKERLHIATFRVSSGSHPLDSGILYEYKPGVPPPGWD